MSHIRQPHLFVGSLITPVPKPLSLQMSKAAHHQSIRRDDFLKVSPEKHSAFHMPHLPSLADGNDDEDELDETIKLQPINIQVRNYVAEYL